MSTLPAPITEDISRVKGGKSLERAPQCGEKVYGKVRNCLPGDYKERENDAPNLR